MIANTDHPATFSAEVLPHLAAALDQVIAAGPYLTGPVRGLDPFAGEGLKFHALADPYDTDLLELVGVELEPEWAANHPRNIVADSTRLPFDDQSFDIAVTSCCYGNRMADDHDNRDACATCGGSGCKVADCLAGHPDDGQDHGPCPVCKGTGLSRRNTYKHRLGRPLTKGTAANLRFVRGRRGDKYRRIHVGVWAEVHRVLRPHAPFVLNVSNYRETVGDQLVEHRVVEWHIDHLLRNGFTLDAIVPIPTRRNRQGANGDTRADQEFVLHLRKR